MKKNLFDRNLKIEITTDNKKLTVKEDKIIIAGPCAIESYDQLLKTAKFVKSKGANILRGGAYKPRTSPNSFQGLKEEGIEILKAVKKETGMAVITELMDIREELGKVGYLRSKNNSKKETKLTTKPHEFVSSNGFKILVGKNNKQNDHLTLKVASNEDIWMHTKNIPGSHVIIKTEGKEVPDETIFEGAMLAAFFSKSKMSSQVPVDYTKKKNVKKPNGAKPGMVIYDTNNTIYVTPTEELVAKLKSKFDN